MKSLLAIAVSFLAGSLAACSCGSHEFYYPMPGYVIGDKYTEREAERNTILFHGIVVDAYLEHTEEGRMAVYKYEVYRSYRGANTAVVTVYSANSSGACGYYDEIGNESIITARHENGRYITYRKDCIQNVSKKKEPAKFDRWLRFLNVVHGTEDGRFSFGQVLSKGSWRNEAAGAPAVPAVTFTVRNGILHGRLMLYRADGTLYATGRFKRGHKQGWWVYPISGMSEDYWYFYEGTRKVKYSDGVRVRERLARQLRPLTIRSK